MRKCKSFVYVPYPDPETPPFNPPAGFSSGQAGVKGGL